MIKLLVKSYWIVNFTVFSVKYIPMYSVQFIVMDILRCRVKCVVHWRGGREGSFPKRTCQPLLPAFKACTVGSTVYCKVIQIMNSIIYSIVFSILYNRVFSSKGTRGKICLSLCCSCRVYHQVRWSPQGTVKCTVQGTVKCSAKCTLYC